MPRAYLPPAPTRRYTWRRQWLATTNAMLKMTNDEARADEPLTLVGSPVDERPTIELETNRLSHLDTRAYPTENPVPVFVAPDEPVASHSERERRLGPSSGLRRVVLALVGLCIAALGGMLALSVQPSWFAGLRDGAQPDGALHRAAPPGTSPAPGAPGAPVIASIRPARGRAGQTVSITGRGIVSGNGTIVALFGSTAAPTQCPTERGCRVVVPPLKATGSSSTFVRLQTAAGLSNAVRFQYG